MVFIECQAVADFVGRDHVQIFAGQFRQSIALDVFRLGGEAHQERW
jgi:hypothetical protein